MCHHHIIHANCGCEHFPLIRQLWNSVFLMIPATPLLEVMAGYAEEEKSLTLTCVCVNKINWRASYSDHRLSLLL